MLKKIHFVLLFAIFPPFVSQSIHAQTLVFEPNELVAASEGAPYNERPRVAFTGDGTAHIVWSKGEWGHEGVFVVSAPPGGDYGFATRISEDLGGVYTVVGSGPSLRTKGNYLAAGWEDRNELNRGTWVARSTDMGVTWEPPLRADPGIAEERLFQAVEVFPDGRMAQTWINLGFGFSEPGHDWTGQDPLGIFSPPIEATASAPDEACDCCYADQVILDDGQTVLLAFRNNESNVREIHVVRSTDGGQSFPVDTRIDETGWTLAACPSTGPSLAAIGDTVLVTWKSGADNLQHIWMARSLDGGATWEPMRMVDNHDGGTTVNYPQVALRDQFAVIVWEFYDQTDGPGIMACGSLDAGQNWGEPVLVTDDSGFAQQGQPSVAISPDLEVEVVWSDARLGSRRIFRARGREGSVKIDDDAKQRIPRAILLTQNRPNPFNPSTTIDYVVPPERDGENVTLEIFDLRGQLVRPLIRNVRQPGGPYSIVWDGRNDLGEMVGSGVYLYRIRVGDVVETRRMMISK